LCKRVNGLRILTNLIRLEITLVFMEAVDLAAEVELEMLLKTQGIALSIANRIYTSLTLR
jgi:hypothetical protein